MTFSPDWVGCETDLRYEIDRLALLTLAFIPSNPVNLTVGRVMVENWSSSFFPQIHSRDLRDALKANSLFLNPSEGGSVEYQ